jgi:cob(I)alamin adenosyltransferase
MKIYTRTGDGGETALFGGGRVPKDHPRVAAYGTVDELNACLGWAVAVARADAVRVRLSEVQHDLFAIGALLATPPAQAGRPVPKGLPEPPLGRVPEMEAWMDEAEERLPELRSFVLPGGSQGAAALHLARTVCRRAERAVVRLAAADPVQPWMLTYLNRLSDLLFTFARLENLEAGRGDVAWRKAPGGGA